MDTLTKLKQLEAMYEGFTATCGCSQCTAALTSIRRWIEEAK